MAAEPARTAVVLMNMGGPLRLGDVRPFLLNLFNDRDIIRLGPAWLQPLIARIIVGLRWRVVTDRYREVGGGSPILRECSAQAGALRKALREAGRSEPVRLVFRYASPRAHGELRALQRQGIRRLLPVSLYPHACRATSGSPRKRWPESSGSPPPVPARRIPSPSAPRGAWSVPSSSTPPSLRN
ncbi:MAG TPA: ferrochelatase, partial [Holophaga sp.]|nr:ferrochelatase [Holophaga sp.]